MAKISDRRIIERLGVFRRALQRVEIFQIRRFGRSAISLAVRTPVLILHTTGRRSGQERETPLAFHRDHDGSLLVVGGASGQSRVPDWVANLRAQPVAGVTLDRTLFQVQADELKGDDKREVWTRLVTVWPRIDSYKRRAGREIPVFRLLRDPAAPESNPRARNS